MSSRRTLIALASASIAFAAAAQPANVTVTFVGAKGSGTMATCELSAKAQSSMDRKITALVVDYKALDAKTGKPLKEGLNSATFGGLAPGSTAEQPLGSANAACDRVRLEIVRAPCVTKGCKPTFAQQGLAGLTSP